MNRKTGILIATLLIMIVFLAIETYMLIRFKESPKPSWLKTGMYMTYEQDFAWNGQTATGYMTWNVTEIADDIAELRLISHTPDILQGNITIAPKESTWSVNTLTREIVSSSDLGSTGKKCPFWIEKTVTIGSLVDLLYGPNTISKLESVYTLGQQRECWFIEYNWPTSSMKRWYDRFTGIVLKIQVVMYRENIRIEATETAVQTNINLAP